MTDTTENRDSLLRKAYGKATQDLRDKHREDFDSLYSARAAELGVEWKPRPTAEQKAAAELAALLEQFPHLREQVAGGDLPASQEAVEGQVQS